MTLIITKIEESDGICNPDCHGCCNLAGDADWSEYSDGEWRRGKECYDAEEQLKNLRAYADHTYYCGTKRGEKCDCGYDAVLLA